ncbi:MAG: hypothetical protein ABJB02_03225, partial [Dokdonella sp.]
MLLLLGVAPAHASGICVNSSALLTSELSTNPPQGTARTINLVQGTYSLGNLDATLSAPMTILGGFTANCAGRSVNAANTTIDMNGNSLSLYQPSGSPVALIDIDGLTVKNVLSLTLVAGQYNTIGSNDPGTVRVSRSRLSGMPGSGTSFDLGALGDSDITLEDVVLDHLPGLDPSRCAVYFSELNGAGTIHLQGVTANLAGITDLCFNAPDSVVQIYNSVIWSSDGSPASIASMQDGQTINIVNTLYRTTTGNPVGQIINPLHTDPQWTNGAAG